MERVHESETRGSQHRKRRRLLKNCISSPTLLRLFFAIVFVTLLWDGGGICGSVEATSLSAHNHNHHELEFCSVQQPESTTTAGAGATTAKPNSHPHPHPHSHHHHLVHNSHHSGAPPASVGGASGVSGGDNDNLLKSDAGNPLVTCQIRTLHPDLDIENLTSVASTQISKLKLVCNDVLFFESVLSPPQLTKLIDLQELSIEKCKLKYLPSGSFNGLYHLRRLSIETGNSDWAARSLELSSGAFRNVPGLKHLNLGFNHMWNLPEKLLCQLTSLQSLNLTHNLLSDMLDLGLPKYVTLSIFESVQDRSSSGGSSSSCLNELKSLDLSYNNLQSLGGRRFETMRRLQDLRIEHNVLDNLQDDSFHGLSTLKLLNLSSNKLIALSSKLFTPCKMLKELDLRNNSIAALSPGLLSTLEHLQILDLSSNQLSSSWITSQEAFRGLVRLIILNLANNQITQLSRTSFVDLHQVQNLNLENNQIDSIEDGTFAHLSNLHTLNLARNKLIRIGSSMLDGLFVLSRLSFDHNAISEIEVGSFRNCTSLQDLGLVGNQFTSVPEALQGLALLKTLDIGENLIATISNDSFQGLGQLYGLRIVGNRLSQLPRNLCDPLKRLRVLNLASNRIAKIGSNSFVGCPDLRVLLLNSNSLEEIPTSLASQLGSLLWLNVSENRLQRLNYHLLPTSLEWIDVSHNEIEVLNGAWNSGAATNPNSNSSGSEIANSQLHSRLRVVDASHNSLSQLDFHAIPPNLETLKLGHNKIVKVAPDTFGRTSHLRRVELYGNQLENLQLSAMRLALPPTTGHGHDVEFYLGGNPFLCDCELEWLTKINQPQLGGGPRQYPLVMDLDAIVCRLAYSRSESRIPLSSMQSSDFLCKYESICFSTCHCCGFTCDCEMTCSSNCSCYHDDNWSANVVDCSNQKHGTVPNNLPMDSTDVYLDGNNIPVLKSHTFIGRKNLKLLYLNDSNIHTIANKSFNGLQSLRILHLENNKLRKLEGYEFEQLTTLNELYLHDNLLEVISNTTFLHLKSLEILRLDGNHLVTFSVWQLSLNPYLVDIGIARNRWNCGDCLFLHQFYGWVTDNSKKIMDLVQIRCVWNNTMESGPHLMDYNNTCGASWTLLPGAFEDFDLNSAYPFILLGSLLLLLVSSATFLVLCRDNVRVWIFAKFGVRVRLCSTRRGYCNDDDPDCNGHGATMGVGPGSDKACSYDAYFIYSEKDEEFVTSRISDDLESIDYYRLCLQNRDLIYSASDLKDIMSSAVECCKSIVIFLSRNFFQADWTSSEYRSALYSVLKSASSGSRGGHGHAHAKPVIIVFIEPIPELEISSDLKSWLRNNKIHKQLHFGSKRFWQTFKYLLPDPSSHYQSNITSHTTTSSSASSATGGAGPNSMSTNERPPSSVREPASGQLKYNSEVIDGLQQHHHHHILSSGQSPFIFQSQSQASQSQMHWPQYAQNFDTRLQPPKYAATTSHSQKSSSSANVSPSHHPTPLPVLGPQHLLNPPSSPSSATSSVSMSGAGHKVNSMMAAGATTTTGKDSSDEQPSSASSIPPFLFQPNACSPVPLGHFRAAGAGASGPVNNSQGPSPGHHPHTHPHHNNNNSNNSLSYNDGEHVYSTLDPPSPQHVQQQQSHLGQQHPQGSLQFPKSHHHHNLHHQQQLQHNQSIMNNIHLPNGYTYSPQTQPQPHPQQPQQQLQWRNSPPPPAPPSYSSPSPAGRPPPPPPVSSAAAAGHKVGLNGVVTTISSAGGTNGHGGHHGQKQKRQSQQQQQKESVQTYLV